MNEYFKKLLSFLESSGGQNTDHPEVTKGLNKGTKAIGEYGMMPKTIQDIAKSNITKNIDSPVDDVISNIDPRLVEEVLKDNPHKYEEYVNKMSSDVLKKSGGDIEEAAMRWLAGQNSSNKRINKITEDNPNRQKAMDYFLNELPGYSKVPQFSDELAAKAPKKDVIFSKIRNNLRKP